MLLVKLADDEQLVNQGGYHPLWRRPPDAERSAILYEVEVNGCRDRENVNSGDATQKANRTRIGGRAVGRHRKGIGNEFRLRLRADDPARASRKSRSLETYNKTDDAATTVASEAVPRVGPTVREQLLLRWELSLWAMRRLCRASPKRKNLRQRLAGGTASRPNRLRNPQASRAD